MNESGVNPSQIKIEVNDWAYNFIYENIILGPSSLKLESEYKLPINGSKALEPIIIPANLDREKLHYESSDERIATVDKNGVVTGVASGEAIITVKGDNGVSVSTKIIVGGEVDTSIEITNGNITMNVGDVEYLDAIVLPTSAVDRTVIWTSNDESIVTVSSYGRLVGVGVGETTVTATSASGHISTINVIVDYQPVSSIYLYSTYSIMNVGDSKRIERITITPYIEDYSNVVFSSSDDEIMTISSLGVMTAHKEGRVTIYAHSLDGKVSSSLNFFVSNVGATKVIVSRQAEVQMNSSYQINASVFPSNTTDQTLTYKSNNPDIATVDENGVVSPINIGTAEIEVICGKVSTKCYVTVLPQKIENISSNEQFMTLEVNQEKELQINVSPSNATFKKFFYSSSDEEVAIVVNGVVKAKSEGIATIIVSSIDGISYNFYVVVSNKEENSTIRKDFDNIVMNSTDESYSLDLNDSEEQLVYSSDNENVAIVSNGKVYNRGAGKCTIYVYENKQLIDTFTVEINEVAKKESGCGCNNSAIMIMITALISMSYIIIKKKH